MKIITARGTSRPNAMTQVQRHVTLTLLLAGALAGCTQDRTMAEVTVTRLGVRGGVAVSPDGLFELSIPESALQADVDVTIGIDRSTLDGENLSPIYQVGPSDLALSADAELIIRVRGELGDFDVDAADLGGSEASFLDGVFDDGTMLLTARTRRPGAYSARRRSRLCVGLECGDTCGIGPVARACNARGRCVPASTPLGCGGGFDGGTLPDVSFPPTDAGTITPDSGPAPSDAGSGVVFESEPNDDLTTNDQLQPGETGTGLIDVANDVDMWAVDVPASGTLTAVTHTQQNDPAVCAGIDTVLDVYDAAGNVIMHNDDSAGRIGCSRVSGPVAAGRYYVAVRNFTRQASATRYYLSVSFVAGAGPDAGVPPPIDAGSAPTDGGFFPPNPDAGPFTPDAGAIANGVESEPNNDVPTSNLLATPSATVQGLLTAGDVDVFSFDVLAPGTLNAYTYTVAGSPTLCRPSVDTVLEVHSFAGVVARNDDTTGRMPCSAISVAVQPGRYFVYVTGFAGSANPNPYYLDVNVQ